MLSVTKVCLHRHCMCSCPNISPDILISESDLHLHHVCMSQCVSILGYISQYMLSHCSLFCCLLDVEECQLSECGGEEELGGGESPLPRSSSTSDITQQLSDTLPGTYEHKSSRPVAAHPDCVLSINTGIQRDYWNKVCWNKSWKIETPDHTIPAIHSEFLFPFLKQIGSYIIS